MYNSRSYSWETAEETCKALALRVKKIRKRRGITQKQLAERSNVSYGSIRRFEQTGDISLRSLVRITTEVGIVGEIRELFSSVPYQNKEEIMREQKIPGSIL